MAINQLNKYVWLVETIHRARNRGGITLKEIQSRWLDSDLSEGTELLAVPSSTISMPSRNCLRLTSNVVADSVIT